MATPAELEAEYRRGYVDGKRDGELAMALHAGQRMPPRPPRLGGRPHPDEDYDDPGPRQ